MQLVVEHARQREDSTARRLAEAERQEALAAGQLRQLESYRADYANGRYGAPGGTVQGRRLVQTQHFLANVERALGDLRRRTAALATRTDESRKALQTARARRQALEALSQRYQLELERQARRQEQRLSDEHAARRTPLQLP